MNEDDINDDAIQQHSEFRRVSMLTESSVECGQCHLLPKPPEARWAARDRCPQPVKVEKGPSTQKGNRKKAPEDNPSRAESLSVGDGSLWILMVRCRMKKALEINIFTDFRVMLLEMGQGKCRDCQG